MSERLITGEKDIESLTEVNQADLSILPADLREYIRLIREEQEDVGWGFRIFWTEDGSLVTVPEKDGWDINFGDTQVNVLPVEYLKVD